MLVDSTFFLQKGRAADAAAAAIKSVADVVPVVTGEDAATVSANKVQKGIDYVAAIRPVTSGSAGEVYSRILQAGHDEVALAATPPVATGGDAATIARRIEAQADAAAPFVGLALRKTLTCRQSTTSTAHDWVRAELTDPDMLAVIDDDSCIQATLADGTPLDTVVIARTAVKLEFAIAWQPSTQDETTIHIYAGKRRLSFVFRDFGPPVQTPAAAHNGPNWTTGRTIDPTNQSVHPHVIRVPAGSWMASDGAGGTVTHVRVDTPFPGGDDQYENPSLAYSTDNGLTWAEWPGVTNPITASPGDGDDFLSDACLTILPSGALRCYYRQKLSGVFTYKYKDISGTNLTDDVVIGAEQSATFTTTVPHSLTVYQVSDDLWYGFGEGCNDPITLEIYRWQSVDQGVTWTDRTAMIVQSADSPTTPIVGWWHGGQVIKQGDYYYAVWTEHHQTPHTTSSIDYAPRLFRSTDLTTWVPSKHLIFTEQPTWGPDRYYTANLYLDDQDRAWIIYSAEDSKKYYTAAQMIGDLNGNALLTEATAIGTNSHEFSRITVNGVLPCVGYFDLAEGPGSGLTDLSGEGNDLTVDNGAPAYTAGVGYDFLASRVDRLTAPITLAGKGEWEIDVEYTTPASLVGDHCIFAEQDASGETAIRLVQSGKKLLGRVYDAAGGYVEVNTGGNHILSPSTRYHLRLVMYQNVDTNYAFDLYIDGRRSYRRIPTGVVRTLSGAALYIGSLVLGGSPGTFTLHRLLIRTAASRFVSGRCSTAVWTAGHTVIG